MLLIFLCATLTGAECELGFVINEVGDCVVDTTPEEPNDASILDTEGIVNVS